MATSIRQEQVGELVRRNLGVVLQSEGSYIYGAGPFVTCTEIQMTSDLGIARVYLSVFGTEDKQSVILKLEEEYARIRQALGFRLRKHVRRIPDLQFYLDDTLDEMYRLREVFDELKEEEKSKGKDTED
ncbi:MAG: 30S ribosome-binding factor RbfA [Saprospiraceae bacterium]